MSLKSPWADSNHFILELMTLNNDQYQDTDWKMRDACNMMMNIKWDEVMTIIGLFCK